MEFCNKEEQVTITKFWGYSYFEAGNSPLTASNVIATYFV
jgi:hypothetical protein